MKKKNLDENSFGSASTNSRYNLTPEQRYYVDYMRNLGFDYQETTIMVKPPESDVEVPAEGWQWIRKENNDREENLKRREQLIASQIEAFRNYYNTVQPAPGTQKNGISVEAYNKFAKWDLWKGGYVADHGYVGMPSSSAYGAPLILSNSWVSQGGSGTSLPEYKFYKLQESGTWSGGYIDNWSYVAQNRRILGSSTDMGFTPGFQADRELANLANLSRLITDIPAEIYPLRAQFAQYLNVQKDCYEIPDSVLSSYFASKYYPALASSIHEALRLRYAVFLRIVTATTNGQTYGDDYVLTSYNPVLQVYQYYDPATNRYGTLDALKIDKGEIPTITYTFKRNIHS